MLVPLQNQLLSFPTLVVLAAVSGVVFGYLWIAPNQAGKMRWLLAGLRLFVLTMILALLLPMGLITDTEDRETPNLAVLVNSSPGMWKGKTGQRPIDVSLNRISDKSFWQKATPGWKITPWCFGDTLQPLAEGYEPQPSTTRNLSKALDILSASPIRPDAVLLLTTSDEWDGDEIKTSLDIPIHIWRVPEENQPHASIIDIEAPPVAYAGELTRIHIQVDIAGVDKVSILLHALGQQDSLAIATASGSSSVEMQFKLGNAGFSQLVAEVQLLPGESPDSAGKTAHFTLPVVDEPIPTHIVTYSPTREGAILTRAWRGDPRLAVNWGMYNNGGRLLDGLAITQGEQTSLLVLENPQSLSSEAITEIKHLISEGAGVIILCSAKQPGPSGLAAIPEVLPGNYSGARTGFWMPRTPISSSLYGIAGISCGGPWSGIHLINPYPATETVLRGEGMGGSLPLAVLTRFGHGKALWVLGMSYAASIVSAPETSEAAWRSLSRQLASPYQGQGVRVVLPGVVRAGIPTEFSFHIPDDTSLVKAVLVGEDGIRNTLNVEKQQGIWQSSFIPQSTGNARIIISSPSGETSIPLYVDPPLMGSGRDSEGLKLLASRLGGKYYAADETPPDSFLSGIEPRTRQTRHYLNANDTIWLSILIIMLLSLEWMVRRRTGLV